MPGFYVGGNILNLLDRLPELDGWLVGQFTPGERAPGTHWIVGWVGPRAGLGEVAKIPCLNRESIPGRQARSLVTVLVPLVRIKVSITAVMSYVIKSP
jgi:hypothetical protein